jgi:hypothetical protein
MMIEADEAEEADVAKVKKAIKGIYDSIPEGKDKTSIVSKAISELDSEIIEKEVKVIKGKLAGIDKETILEAAKDYVGIEARDYHLPACEYAVSVERPPLHDICMVGGCIKYMVTKCIPGCLHKILYEVPPEWEINPRIKEQLTEEIFQEIIQSPELSRAMKKMLKKIQDEK